MLKPDLEMGYVNQVEAAPPLPGSNSHPGSPLLHTLSCVCSTGLIVFQECNGNFHGDLQIDSACTQTPLYLDAVTAMGKTRGICSLNHAMC